MWGNKRLYLALYITPDQYKPFILNSFYKHFPMKYSFSIVLLSIAILIKGQNLPVNSKTGLVSVQDSVILKNNSLQEIKDHLIKWGHTLIDEANVKAIFKLNNAKQTEFVSINLPVGTVLTRDQGGNKFSTNGSLGYGKVKTVLNTPIVTSGGIKFIFTYIVYAKKIIFEFSNFEYSHDMVHFGKFEDEKPPKDNYNRSMLFKMGKKEWQQVRQEYYADVKILANNLKEYLTNLTGTHNNKAEQTKITYANYQAIKTGMSYDEIKALLDDEGKEISNSVVQENGKNVARQVIIWRDLDETKSITISFSDGKVISKIQSNL